MRLLCLALCAALGAACLPAPRGRCSADGDCAGGPAGLFCAEGVCQSPPMFHADVPRDPAERSDTATVLAQLASAHGGVAAATAHLDVAGTTLQPLREAAATLRFDVPLSLAPAGTEGALPFHLVVTDDLGHQTALDDSLAFDDAPPAIAIAADATWHPLQPLTLSASVADLTLDATTILLTIGGATLQPSSSSGANYTFAVPTSALPADAEGPVPFTVSARDRFGHSTAAPGTLLVDDLAPRAAFDAATLPAAAVLRGTLVTLHALVDDASPLTVTWSLAGQPDANTQPLDARTFAFTFDTSTLSPGLSQAVLTVKATDAAGNVGMAMTTIGVTRLRWHEPLSNPSLLNGLALNSSSVMITNNSTEVMNVDRNSGLQGASVTLASSTSGSPIASDVATYVVLTNNSICKVGTQVEWCCGPFGNLSSPMAFGQFNGVSGLIDTVLIGSTGDPDSGGQRLYAVRDGQNGTTCHYDTSSLIESFEGAAPVIAADSTIFLTLPDTIVAARFDGFSWTAGTHSFPNHSFNGMPALGNAADAGQPLIAATGDGFVDEFLFPLSAALPPDPPAGTGFATSVAGTSYAASGATIAEDGTIVVGTDDHRVVALDAGGHQKWAVALNGKPGGPPTQGAGNIAYAADATGTLTAINVADGSVRWTFAAGAALRVPPALGCDGTLYLGADDGSVYALVSDSLGLADSPWPRPGRDNRGTGDARRKLRGADGGCLE